LHFCENETNVRRLYGQTAVQGFFKDAFHELVIAGNKQAVNPRSTGTKAAALYRLSVAAGESACVRLRLVAADVRRQRAVGNVGSNDAAASPRRLPPLTDFDELFEQRRREADDFYGDLQKDIADPDARNVQRQALAGMIWSKQFFYYDVPDWL